jgi:hypothetical protein
MGDMLHDKNEKGKPLKKAKGKRKKAKVKRHLPA